WASRYRRPSNGPSTRSNGAPREFPGGVVASVTRRFRRIACQDEIASKGATMDEQVVARAVELSRTDGEFGLYVRHWDGAIVLAQGADAWRVALRSGGAEAPEKIDASSINASLDEPVISATADAWDKLCASPPPSPYTDVFGAERAGDMAVT